MSPPKTSFSLVPLDEPAAGRKGKPPAPDAAASGPAESLIDWPLPPFHEDAGDLAPVFENAIVHYRDGHRLSGRLMRFSPATGLIEFCPEKAATAHVVAITDILELRLPRPIRLRRRDPRLGGSAGDASAPSTRQPFRIGLANNGEMSGETVGFQVHTVGIFLYLPSHRDLVIRTFVPTSAIREKQIGKRLGELLVDGKKLSPEALAGALDKQQAKRTQKLGEMLAESHVVEPDALLTALKEQRSRPVMRLGEALIALGTIKPEQLEQALERQKKERGKPIGELLVEMGALTRADLVRALTQKLGIPYVDLDRFPIDRRALDLVPRAVAIEHNVLPLCMDGKTLVIAVENPLDPKPLDRVRFLAATSVTAVMASGDDIRRAIARHFVDPSLDAPIEFIAAELGATDGLQADAFESDADDAIAANDSALVRLVNKTIADARAAGASDIHVECNGGKSLLRIRFRQDGVLREYLTLPPSYRRPLVSRIKIMAQLDISEHRKGQDGKIRFGQAGMDPLELRVATVPTFDGREDVVLRLLASGAPLSLAKIGLEPKLREQVEALVGKPSGVFLVCGPTGSGKSTTLHSILAHLNTPDRKIWTAEDPVEIQQENLRQVQVHPKIGWTFAAAMRSFLRADPDVIMVGEMRDEETAQIAVEASLTGHVVFSTLHTNSAVESVVRLLDMGVQPFNFADSLLGVLAQRLVRRLCEHCKRLEPLDETRAAALATEYCGDTGLQPRSVLSEWEGRYGPLKLASAAGCEACRDSGYKGRMGLHELFVNSPRIAPLIHKRANALEIKQQAVKDGLRTLKQDGIEKCLQGLTDLAEVRRSCM